MIRFYRRSSALFIGGPIHPPGTRLVLHRVDHVLDPDRTSLRLRALPPLVESQPSIDEWPDLRVRPFPLSGPTGRLRSRDRTSPRLRSLAPPVSLTATPMGRTADQG